MFGANSPGPMCQGVKDTVLGRKVVLSVPMEVLEISRVRLGAGETRVSKKGMELLLFGASVVNGIYGSVEFIC